MKDKQAKPRKIRFSLGEVLITPGASWVLWDAGQAPEKFLGRHETGDWGELDEKDRQANERALQEGARRLSAYRTAKEVKLWVITEADRSVTTLLLPDEY